MPDMACRSDTAAAAENFEKLSGLGDSVPIRNEIWLTGTSGLWITVRRNCHKVALSVVFCDDMAAWRHSSADVHGASISLQQPLP
jgi:hypothetical protein